MAPLTVARGDITRQVVDVVVNAADRAMRGGGGVDGAIHRAGGPAVLRDCIVRFPRGLATGEAGWTTAGDLPARWIVHTVGPDYRAGQRDRGLLESCYRRSVEVADELGARSMAFPLVSAGVYGWPLEDAARAAVGTVTAALHGTRIEEVLLVAFDEQANAALQAALVIATPLRILQGVRELHRRGYQGVRARPGMSPSGMYWRIEIRSPGAGATGNEGATDAVVWYTTGDGTCVAGGRVDATTDAESVADLLLGALHGAVRCPDPAYAQWLEALLELVARHARLPIAFADYFDDTAGWEIGWGSGLRHPHPPDPAAGPPSGPGSG